MKRRDFAQLSSLAGLGLLFPIYGCKNNSATHGQKSEAFTPFEKLSSELLTTWCDAMIAAQIDDPAHPELHGALYCNACEKIHGRCMDAVYPFLYLADTTGEESYLTAAINVMKWSENVSRPDGSWTVIPNPKSWRGITVFGAIALGEALHHHGHVLPNEIKEKWTERLKKAADFIHANFTIDYSHINYAFTAVYALNFLGKMFQNEDYLAHSKQLASKVPKWLTDPNKLIFGENKLSRAPSAKGLLPVDLGYNVEETLNGLVQYAVMEKDEELLKLLTASLNGHLEFMLPDGAWDNSWGTRQNKWSYWGSRTTDGCQPGFALMADRNQAFATAAYLNTELLERCTVNGLLAGGLHYDSHGVLPCIHHSFAHAKSLAFVLDNREQLPTITKTAKLPRQLADGVKHFTDLDVWTATRGKFMATVSSNDVVFKKKYSQTATGGSLAVLWHDDIGPIFTASMAEYILAEVNNQQPQPNGEDIPLTPRLAVTKNDTWYSNLFDLKAKVDFTDNGEIINFKVETQLTDREGTILENGGYVLEYLISNTETIIKATLHPDTDITNNAALVLPLISPTGEKVIQAEENHIKIEKEGAVLNLRSNVPLLIKKTKKERVFNMVPGMEAVPVQAFFEAGQKEIICTVSVS